MSGPTGVPKGVPLAPWVTKTDAKDPKMEIPGPKTPKPQNPDLLTINFIIKFKSWLF